MMQPNKLEQFLQKEIGRSGSIPLGDFMSHALNHPEYGYYHTQNPFGIDGDFITAPEVSQIFGELIGAWVIDTWMQVGQPIEFNLIECGPGRGTLMSDILRVSRRHEAFIKAAHVYMLESSESLKISQAKTLEQYGNVHWINTLDQLDKLRPTIIMANEFLDALPIEQLMRSDKGWQQKILKCSEGGAFIFDWQKADTELVALLPSKTESNQIYEISPTQISFVKQCADLIKANKGVALYIDYGYITRHYGDTLQAVYKHEYAPVLERIGQQDITAHVDFEMMLKTASAQDCDVFNITTQGRFLNALGLQQRASALKNVAHNEAVVEELDQAVKRLTSVEQMGELFKVCSFSSGFNFNPAGL